MDEQHGEHDVQQVLADVDDERGARVLMGVEHAQHEQVDGEPDQTECEAGESA